MDLTTKIALGMAQLYRKNWDNPDTEVLNQIVADICRLAGCRSVDQVELLRQLKLR